MAHVLSVEKSSTMNLLLTTDGGMLLVIDVKTCRRCFALLWVHIQTSKASMMNTS